MSAALIMRVLVMTETFSPEVGGGERQAGLLASGLARRGHDVTVLTRRSRADSPRNENAGDIRVIRVAPTGSGRLRKWGLLATTPAPLLGWRDQLDVILVSGFRILGIPAVPAARWLRVPLVLKADSNGEMSGDFYRAGLARWNVAVESSTVRGVVGLRNRLLRRATAFVGISSQIEAELRTHGVASDRIVRIPNGVDVHRFRPASPAERDELRRRLGVPAGPVAIYTGRLVSYKGLPLLMRVWSALSEQMPGATLLLVGEGGNDMHACETELRHFVAQHGLAGRVRFTGPVDRVEDWLRAADVFVFPTENEAFGLALVEAMACGLAVVTTAVGGIADFVEAGRNAFVVHPADPYELHCALERALADRDRAAELGAAARAIAEQMFSEEAVVTAYELLFRKLIAERGRAAA